MYPKAASEAYVPGYDLHSAPACTETHPGTMQACDMFTCHTGATCNRACSRLWCLGFLKSRYSLPCLPSCPIHKALLGLRCTLVATADKKPPHAELTWCCIWGLASSSAQRPDGVDAPGTEPDVSLGDRCQLRGAALCKTQFKTHHSHCIGAGVESTAGAFTQLSDEAPQALTWELRARRSLESPGSDPNRQGQDREPVVPLHVEQVRGSGFSCERTLNNYRASTMMRHQRPCKPSISRSKAPIFCVLACARCTP